MLSPLWVRLRTEPYRPVWLRHRPNAGWFAVAAVSFGAFMGQLDASIVTVALPAIRKDLHTSVAGAEWVGLAYLLTLVSTIVTIGRFSDIYGRKLMYTYGFVVFTAASAGCALSPGLATLLVARVVQGVGAAMLQANSIALISTLMPRERLPRALGIQGTAQALGLLLGPMAGGVLLASGGWRLIFLINVPIGVVAIVLARMLLPRSRDLNPERDVNVRGALLFAGSVSAGFLVLSSLSTGNLGWPGGGTLLGCLALGWAFLRHERGSRAPLLDSALLRPPVRGYLGAAVLSYVVLFGALFITPFRLASLGVPVALIGVADAALPLGFAAAAPLAGWLIARRGSPAVGNGGVALASLAVLAGIFLPSGAGWTAASLAALGVGLGLFNPTNNAAVMLTTPPAQAGLVSGMINMARGLGTSLGLALTTVVYAIAGGNAGHPASGYRSALALLLLCSGSIAVVIRTDRAKS